MRELGSEMDSRPHNVPAGQPYPPQNLKHLANKQHAKSNSQKWQNSQANQPNLARHPKQSLKPNVSAAKLSYWQKTSSRLNQYFKSLNSLKGALAFLKPLPRLRFGMR